MIADTSSSSEQLGYGSPTSAPAEFEWNDSNLACSSAWLLSAIRAELRSLQQGSVVADFGCGNGSMLAHLRDLNFELHGLDNSTSGLAQARTAYPDINFSYVDLMSDLASHSLAGKCDVVISTEVVEHLFLPRLFARNCHAMLRAGGMLVLSTPYHGYLKNLALAISGKMDSHFTALWDYGHIKFWSRKTLTTLLEEAHFAVNHFRGVGRVPFLWKSMLIVARKLS